MHQQCMHSLSLTARCERTMNWTRDTDTGGASIAFCSRLCFMEQSPKRIINHSRQLRKVMCLRALPRPVSRVGGCRGGMSLLLLRLALAGSGSLRNLLEDVEESLWSDPRDEPRLVQRRRSSGRQLLDLLLREAGQRRVVDRGRDRRRRVVLQPRHFSLLPLEVVGVLDLDLDGLAAERGERLALGWADLPPAVRSLSHGGLHLIERSLGHVQHLLGRSDLAVGLDSEASLRPLGVRQREGAQGAPADVHRALLLEEELGPLVAHAARFDATACEPPVGVVGPQ
mmetsp:Transcript_36695/g.78291  ORF Transcript_36695/g.78291 Transcript_36695/m.78291 type:complete len:284 (-) Transcript_36695:9-860(-)